MIAVVTTFARLDGPDGKPGSSLAVGFLVPMFGFGLNGLWARTTATFGRAPTASATPAPKSPQRTRRSGRMTTMAETASETITIAAAAGAGVGDRRRRRALPRLGQRREGRRRAVARRASGRPTEVEFRASALGRSTHYTLAYDYSEAPEVLAWKMVSGDIQRSIEGAYHFAPTDDGGTEVRYDLAIELVVAAARLRQAARRGAHPQHGARAEDARRGLSASAVTAGRRRHRRRRHEVPRRRRSTTTATVVAETARPTPHGPATPDRR